MHTHTLENLLDYLKQAISDYEIRFPEETLRLRHLKAQLREEPEKLFDRKNMRGHVTSSGLILDEKTKKFLLIEHPVFKLKVQPGGHVDNDGLSIPGTSINEVTEETGYTFTLFPEFSFKQGFAKILDIDTHFIDTNPKKQEGFHYHHDLVFLIKGDENASRLESELDTDKMYWLTKEEGLKVCGFPTRWGRLMEKVSHLL